MNDASMDRRRFLKGSGGAAGMATIAVIGGTVTLLAPKGSFALQAFSAETAETLLQMMRAMYPHDALGDQYYAAVVVALNEEADADPAALTLITSGLEELNSVFPLPFTELSPQHRLDALDAIKDGELFQKVAGKVIGTLYNQPRVWQAFGYEGASYDEGGYILRGFNDLGWLPDPPPEASPPVQL